MAKKLNKLTWEEAIIIALGENAKGDESTSMHYKAITNYIIKNEIYKPSADAKTPCDTVNSRLGSSAYCKRFGEPGSGKYQLNEDGLEVYESLKKQYERILTEDDSLPSKSTESSVTEIHIGKLNVVDALKSNHNIILHGAPGTGKTYLADKIVEAMKADKDEDDVEKKMVQFHPSYDYTDFVEGLRPKSNTNGEIVFERKDGVFKAFCKEAVKNYDSKKYIFIIDEINRGDMSKIFGELFFSIEPGYRANLKEKDKIKVVDTQYQNMLIGSGDKFEKGFYIPDNVYIIGTMNDIDRSVESMDFAMRRRFQFIEVKAEDRVDQMFTDEKTTTKYENEADAKNRLINLNNCLSGRVEDGGIGLSSAYHIGPSYFIKLAKNEETADDLWNYRIKGLLREYLRGDDDIDKKIAKLHNAYNDVNESKADNVTTQTEEQTNG